MGGTGYLAEEVYDGSILTVQPCQEWTDGTYCHVEPVKMH